ncbi:GntR family transcriptional regulator [Krasilnikovia cinnamomea]|uniref:GntR family transcriptional regulator n=1 Tax=Krasilnikovia cinnamomea TaxID=349313 RepID=A0A4Q7ZSJ2_9ACTN|nr:GntR family transcriptional regulator [Krasilnikovia cinnamomea]RZU53593.1 GntR family transcriptional regulator [Krasilnikovia cinnamomea]
MGDGKLQSQSLVDLALDRLSREILSGRVYPGERLVEEQLTRRLGISRGPLREALRLLAQRGLVEHVPRRGARVATLSGDDVRELYEIRTVLERHAAASIPPDADLSALQDALDAMRKSTESGDRPAVADAHRRFHVEVVALGGNRQLCRLYESVLVRLQLYMAANLHREAEVAAPADGVQRHERLLAAIASKDVNAIISALTGHGSRTYLP